MTRSLILDDDPRHGTNAGYVAGCRCQPCSLGRLRYNKAHKLKLLRGARVRYSEEEVREVIAPWLRLGLTESAIQEAAGVSCGHAFSGSVLASTYRALLALTEADLPGKATVFSGLTKRRVYSLMAAGHRLDSMPIQSNGVWRTRDRIRVTTARQMRDFYAANEFKLGGSRQTTSRARNAGHVPPLAWDDPGTLAWPSGRPERIVRGPLRPTMHDIDPMVVARVVAGEFRLPTTRDEKRAVVAEFVRRGRPLKQLENAGWKPDRYLDHNEDLEETA